MTVATDTFLQLEQQKICQYFVLCVQNLSGTFQKAMYIYIKLYKSSHVNATNLSHCNHQTSKIG